MIPGNTDSAGGSPAETVANPAAPAVRPVSLAQPASLAQPSRHWKLAAGGAAVAVLGGAALMQVWGGTEGSAAETPVAGKATVAAAPAAVPGRARYLARVGDAVVTYDQVADEAMARYGTEVLDQIINRTLIELACREQGIVVSEAEVEQEITNIAQEFGLDRTNWLQMLQAERDLTPLQYKRDVIWPMLALKKLAGSDVQITQQDIQKAFERDYGPRVKARMIMMDNQRRMTEIWQQANEDKTAAAFGRLAREHSMEPTSKSMDGVIPPIRRHSGQDTLETAAFNLKPGEVSGVVQLSLPGMLRYVILFSEGQTEPVVKPEQLSLVQDDIVKQIKKEKVQENVAGVFTKIKEKTPVHNFLTNTSTGGVTQTGAAAAFSPARK